jgi:chromosome segregation ATPase
MFGKLRTLWTPRRNALSHVRPSPRPTPLRLEYLEDRALPSVSSLLLGGHQAMDLRADLKDVKADVKTLSTALASNTAVAGDLTSLNTALSAVSADLTNGTSAVADLKTLAAAETTLAKDLGTNVTTSVRGDLRDLGNDVRDLSKDASQAAHKMDPDDNRHGDHNHDRDDRGPSGSLVAQAQAVQSALNDVTADAKTLSTALASNTNTTIVSDLSALNSALSAVSTDLTNGTSAVNDLKTLAAAETTLTKDLGTTVSTSVQHDLRDLGSDLTNLSSDVGRLTNSVNGAVSDIQADASQLTSQLGLMLNPTATTALNTLNTDVATLGADLTANKPISGDLTTVLKDEFALIQALGGQATGAAHTFFDLATDLTSVAIATSLSA